MTDLCGVCSGRRHQAFPLLSAADMLRMRLGWLEAVTWVNRRTQVRDRLALRNVFLFVGAEPQADWLASCGVRVDHGASC